MGKKKKNIDKIKTYEDCDDMFAFIAGYTEAGFPYGVTWEEVGIDVELPFMEMVKIYGQGQQVKDKNVVNFLDDIGCMDEELPFN